MKKKFMGNANKKEMLLVTNCEIFFIAIIFLFLFWVVYPGGKIIDNALKENKNFDLTEIYLKNIVRKYPSLFEAYFALAEIYLKQGHFQKAEQVLKHLNSFNDKKISTKRELYMARAVLFSISQENAYDTLMKLRKYYLSEDFMQIEEKEKYLSEYIDNLIASRLYSEAAVASIEAMKKAKTFRYKKLCFNLYLKTLRAGKLLKKEINSLDLYVIFFILDDEMVNEILKAYLEAERPDKAAHFAQKALVVRKML